MENDKSTITKELDHIRNSINKKNETQSDDNFILLDKIVSKGKKYDQKIKIDKKSDNKDIREKNSNITQNKIISKLKSFYKKDHFVKILKKDQSISTNDVINTNNCVISVCKSSVHNKLIILSSIDNLIKGGAGQAIQNLNIKFNFPKKMALI